MTPPAVDMGSVRRVLIIKMSALGDVVHALPVSAALHDAFPQIELTWLVEEAFAPLVTGNPCLARVLTWPKVRGKKLRSFSYHLDYIRRLGKIRSHHFDLTLDLQGLSKSALIAAASGAKVRLGYHWLREAAGLLERPVPMRPESVHIVDQYLDVARFLGANGDDPRFPFHIPDVDNEAVDGLLREAGLAPGAPFISINPASAQARKQWSAQRYAELIDRIHTQFGVPSVVVTADLKVAAEVESGARGPFINLAGKTNLKQLAAIIQRGAFHISADTGSGHLAAALKRPVICLMGVTNIDRLGPYGQRENVIRHSDLCGVNCNGRKCEFSTPRCMEAIQVAEVIAKVEQHLSG